MKRHRFLRWSAATALVLMLVLLAITTLVLTTNWGARMVVNVATRYAPLRVEVAHMDGTLLSGLTLRSLNVANEDMQIAVQQVQLQVARSTLFKPTDIVIDRLAIAGVVVRLPQPDPSAQTDTQPFRVPALPQFSSPVALQIKQLQIDGVQAQDANGRRTLLSSLTASLGLVGDQLTLGDARLATPSVIVAGDVAVQWLASTSVEATLDWQLGNAGDVSGANDAAQGRLTLSGTRERLQVSHVLLQPIAAQTEGRVSLPVDAPVHMSLVTRASDVTLPLNGAKVGMNAVVARLQGVPDDWALSATGAVAAVSQPAVPFVASVSGSMRSARVEEFRLGSDATGKALVEGSLQWLPKLSGDAEVRVDALDLTSLFGIDGTLDGVLAVQSADINAGVFELELERLTGSVLGHRVAGDGALQRIDGRGFFGTLQLAAGADSLRINAAPENADPALDVAFDIKQLSDYVARARGSVQGTLNIIGRSMADATVRGRVNARQLQLDDGVVLATLSAEVTGTRSAHRIEISADSQAIGMLSVEADGAWGGAQWDGKVQSALLQSRRIWQGSDVAGLMLAQPMTLGVSAQSLTLESSCWDALDDQRGVVQSAALCVAADIDAGAVDVDVDVTALPIDYDFETGLNVAAKVSLSSRISGAMNSLEAVVRLSAADTQLNATTEDGLQTVSIDVLTIDGVLANGELEIRPEIAIAQRTRLSGAVFAADCCTASTDAQLSGKLEWVVSDLAFVNALQDAVQIDSGNARLALVPSGSLAAPAIAVDGTANAAEVSVYANGVKYRQVTFKANSEQAGLLSWSGAAQSDDGSISLAGEITQPLTSQRNISAVVQLDNAQLLDLPDMTASADADMRIESSAQMLAVTGSAALTRARVTLRELPRDSVTVSQDIRQEGQSQSEASKLRLDLDIALGEDTQLQGFGLDAGIAGTLDLRKRAQTPLSGYGELRTREATYKSYGQTLQVTRGRLRFDGPLQQPALTIRAERTIQDQSVGVDISGYPGDLRSSLFATPSLPDAETLSLLLTGRQLSSANASEGSALTDAALTLGLRQAVGVTGAIRDAVGLDTLTVAGSGRDGRLLAGKQISSDIYLQYAYGVFDQLSSVLLRWQLNSRLALESRSGDTQSVDLIYQVGNPRQ